MCFLALSQAPPPEVIDIATNNPVIIAPTRSPPRACGPRRKPTKIGTRTGIKAGIIICLMALPVTMLTHFPYSGFPSPVIIPFISRN